MPRNMMQDGRLLNVRPPPKAMRDLFDVLGQRWAMRVLWELRAETLNYRELAARIPEMSTSVLTSRLRELRAARLVEHEPGAGYQLSPRGQELVTHLETLGEWVTRVRFSSGR